MHNSDKEEFENILSSNQDDIKETKLDIEFGAVRIESDTVQKKPLPPMLLELESKIDWFFYIKIILLLVVMISCFTYSFFNILVAALKASQL